MTDYKELAAAVEKCYSMMSEYVGCLDQTNNLIKDSDDLALKAVSRLISDAREVAYLAFDKIGNVESLFHDNEFS